MQDILGSPFFSAYTIWGSSIPSTLVLGTFTPVYDSGKGGTASPCITIPIGAMSLSSKYQTPRSGILSFAGEDGSPGMDSDGEGEECYDY